ncbi:histidinol phosphate phosphatase [Acetobacter lambici]|uniref:Histidinol phosphate phosphatase n=1 Tax=Acetobacter lambici TaxID=1332824 RepID=A0ABT1EVR0_9PROT|nr:inositol monophosphatase family protein [Acetobacter lambici]MCP1241294.1 histidinol phosphate phosphatase [Acetobacter lambici]MCP1257036.1 histidinol phosphate phosphatase [Acetobacter lambici]NHO55529.1 histidinol phosphate phosphatase [Acetobacter lambici]
MSQQQTIDQFVEVASMLADTARSVVRPWFRRGVDVDSKKDASPVTVADRTAERVMRAILAERLPDHGVFGEEFGQNNAGADYQWLLDPVDGTRAFVTGRPLFGTLIALFYKGEPILGILDQPVLAERWVGVKGRKTVFASTLGGQACTRQGVALESAEMSCTSPEMLELAPHDHWKLLKQQARRMTWGGDCYAYGLLALGQIDLIAECDMNPWDWGALVPIVQGAGGVMSAWDGSPLRMDGDRTVLAAGSASLHSEAVRILRAGP